MSARENLSFGEIKDAGGIPQKMHVHKECKLHFIQYFAGVKNTV